MEENYNKKSFTFIDLFAGLGGFHLAMEKLGGKCVFASELKDDLRELYKKNFGLDCAGDINEIDIKKDIPDGFTMLCAGFPCQPFSKAELLWQEKNENDYVLLNALLYFYCSASE